jgi:hypothetical protein
VVGDLIKQKTQTVRRNRLVVRHTPTGYHARWSRAGRRRSGKFRLARAAPPRNPPFHYVASSPVPPRKMKNNPRLIFKLLLFIRRLTYFSIHDYASDMIEFIDKLLNERHSMAKALSDLVARYKTEKSPIWLE